MIKRNWWQQKLFLVQYFWRWCWMSRAEREQRRAMRKLFFNLLSNAPIEKIMARETCSWNMTPRQKQGAMEGVQQYVKAVTGENVKVATRQIPEKTETDIPVADDRQPSNSG